MKLVEKQLIKALYKNKIFLALLLLLTIFTPFVYFFVHFSVDGNMIWLDALPTLNENELLYRNGLVSNEILAFNILGASSALTGFVFAMFFYRFFKTGSKQLGCLKALGFKDGMLRGFFVIFTAILSLIGALIGLLLGYFASDILITAGLESYRVSGFVKGVDASSVAVGLFVPTALFCFITFLTYYVIRGKETGLLLTGIGNQSAFTGALHFANKIAGVFPKEKRLAVRLAIRKPIAVLLIVISVISFSALFILGYSLTLSSQKVFESQTVGHQYLVDTQFDQAQSTSGALDGELHYLDTSGTIEYGDVHIEQTITGMEDNRALYALSDANGNSVALPRQGEMVISLELQEKYGLQQGNRVTITVGQKQCSMKITDIAFNAKAGCVYVSREELSQLLSLPADSYTGILSMENRFEGGRVTTNEQKLDALHRGAVSNRGSALINQGIGCLMGCILLLLALLLNFQDSTRDILILHLMGYKVKSIRKMLIDIYKPILWLSFLLTLFPAIQIVKAILKSISLQIGDYMPFQTNVFVIIGVFVLLNAIYFLVQATFNLGIGRIIKKENISDYVNES